jgi:predicted transglutaminase-like cysteine proteinase
MFKKIMLVAASAAFAFSAVQPAVAAGPTGLARHFRTAPSISYIVANKRTTAPFAHVRFCMDNPSQCISGGAAMMDMDADREDQLVRVNTGVNRSIKPVNDSATTAAGDVWSLDVAEGDCEDFALTKREKLLAMGWSPRALRIAMATTASGVGHAVLVVKTDKGDLVLDNRTSQIKNWRYTDLKIVKIQSGDNARQWYTL